MVYLTHHKKRKQQNIKYKNMKKVTYILGAVLIAVVLISFTAVERHQHGKKNAIESLFIDINNPFEETLKKQGDVITLNPSTDLNVIEVEEEVELGIDTTLYLPYGFDPYKGFQLNVADISVIEIEEEVELDFDVNDYLPADFNPYKI